MARHRRWWEKESKKTFGAWKEHNHREKKKKILHKERAAWNISCAHMTGKKTKDWSREITWPKAWKTSRVLIYKEVHSSEWGEEGKGGEGKKRERTGEKSRGKNPPQV